MKRAALPIPLVLPLVTVVGAAAVGATLGVQMALLVIAGGALVGVIALLWASVQSLTGESPLSLEEALTLAAPSAEEEQKRAVLRALKDLEYERSVGKISEEDYGELSARYRAEARRLMAVLDAEGAENRAEVERRLAERVSAHAARKKEAKAAERRRDEDATPPASDDDAPDEDEDDAPGPDDDEASQSEAPSSPSALDGDQPEGGAAPSERSAVDADEKAESAAPAAEEPVASRKEESA